MNPEFATHKLNAAGTRKAEKAKRHFNLLLSRIHNPHDEIIVPQGRYLSLIKTKLEEAFLFTLRAIESDPANQLPDVDGLIAQQNSFSAILAAMTKDWVSYNFKYGVTPKKGSAPDAEELRDGFKEAPKNPFSGVFRTTDIEAAQICPAVDLPSGTKWDLKGIALKLPDLDCSKRPSVSFGKIAMLPTERRVTPEVLRGWSKGGTLLGIEAENTCSFKLGELADHINGFFHTVGQAGRKQR
jgi:hypothetical protein